VTDRAEGHVTVTGRTKRLRERAALLAKVRAFFVARDFLEVETPIVVPSPGLDLHLDAFAVDAGKTTRYLTTSPEYQMKRLLAEGYPRIFQITKAFRRGELGARHNPEFSLVEWYRTNAGATEVMCDTEQLVAAVTGGVVVLGERVVDVSPPFARMTVGEAFERYAACPFSQMLQLAERDEDTFFRLLVDRVEPALERQDRPVFLTEYPATQASLARKDPRDARVAERFELYLAGVELCNGFGELTDPVEQRARLLADQSEREARGLPVYPIDEAFLAALEKGIPPSGGNALGLDRLIALACGTKDIAAVLSFTDSEL
jgi:lysyl-tRNA synthetase class 2